MDNYNKILAIAYKVHLFGGTTIQFDGNFVFGGLHLYRIKCDGRLVFSPSWEALFRKTAIYEFPLEMFGEKFFANLFPYYLNACKSNLTAAAYTEILHAIEWQ